MMRFIDKKELSFKNGYICEGDMIVAIDDKVIHQVNSLEHIADTVNFVLDNKDKIDAALNPTELPKYKPVNNTMIKTETKTPKLDEYTETIKGIIDELETKGANEEMEEIINKYCIDLIEWLNADEIIVNDDCQLPRKLEANPLDMDVDHVVSIIQLFVELSDEVEAVTA